MSYQTATPAKFTHIIRVRRAGSDTAFTLCGRRANIMATGKEAEATCTRCLAESLSRETASNVEA